MPSKTKIQTRPVKEKEKHFVNLYIRAGAIEEKIAYCEGRADLKPGHGKKILNRKTVQADIHARMEPVRLEQFRQKVLSEAAEAGKQQQQQELRDKVRAIKKIDPELLENELMEGAIGLNWHQWPKEKLEVIKTAAIWASIFESGNTRRLQPAESGQLESTSGIYTALFARLGSGTPQQSEPAKSPENAQDDVFDLVPPSPQSIIPPAQVEEPAVSRSAAKVITVEVG